MNKKEFDTVYIPAFLHWGISLAVDALIIIGILIAFYIDMPKWVVIILLCSVVFLAYVRLGTEVSVWKIIQHQDNIIDLYKDKS